MTKDNANASNETDPTETDRPIDPRIVALAKFLDVEPSEIDEGYGENTYEFDRQEWLVRTDEEADQAVRAYVENSAWAFNAEFIVAHSALPFEAIEMVRSFQEAKCEGANDTILALISDLDTFAADAASADGRGHFLAGYDGEEHAEGEFYLYRNN